MTSLRMHSSNVLPISEEYMKKRSLMKAPLEHKTLWTKYLIHSFTDVHTAILTKPHEFLNKALSLLFYYSFTFSHFSNMIWTVIIA